jgi:serine/threonine-protein kinase
MAIPEAAPARLGRYELVARLATGGMGEIFLARLEGAAGFEKLFVIKRILPHLADDVRFRGMLIAEARIASVMTHANICQVYELGETDGQLYIVMEYLEGITALPLLHRMSKEGRPLKLGFVVGVIQQAIDGLHYAHELKDRSGEYLGIVHRDVTPSNIFLTDAGIVKILDFGIAKVKASAHTETGTVKGKYAYMAPEQLRGGGVDRRADVFALGIVLFEMLALRRLFQRKTDYLTFRAVMEQPTPDVRHYRPDCPPALAAAVARALDRDPAVRFATARQFGSAVLDAVAASQRPWSQGEIGDFVTGNFADEIEKRGAQIAQVVGVGGPPRVIPALIDPDDGLDVETDDEFPPVDSTLTDAPVPSPSGEQFIAVDGPTAAGPGPIAVTRIETPAATGRFQTPPPPVTNATGPLPVVAPRRSVVWPLLAFPMVAVTGGALFLVWHQMENQRPTEILITNSTDSRIANRGSSTLQIGAKPAEPEPPGRTGSAAPRTSPPVQRTPHTAVDSDPRYDRVVHAHDPDVARCGADHGLPPQGSELAVVIAPDGRPKRVEIESDAGDTAALAACLAKVFADAKFPRGKGDVRFHTPFKTVSHPPTP